MTFISERNRQTGAMNDNLFSCSPPQKGHNAACMGVSAAGAKFYSFLSNPPLSRDEGAGEKSLDCM